MIHKIIGKKNTLTPDDEKDYYHHHQDDHDDHDDDDECSKRFDYFGTMFQCNIENEKYYIGCLYYHHKLKNDDAIRIFDDHDFGRWAEFINKIKNTIRTIE
ncbi:hypothetical protein DERF_014923 [Dermatophagoides farinae]|uniref:Uncharacterized protein n=1 Tax=Dermatophagoides farinae TaxID=6954 RepID=A0A922HNE0_DERFA|nr:hypothetical protein DERF_014923 [Dermatophagoides farinae]